MNEYDSALVESILQKSGLFPAQTNKSADFLLINTCSVRQHAENRVFSLLSQYKNFKDHNPGMKILLLGCMASEHKESLLKQFPALDYVVGPEGYRNLPRLIEEQSGASVCLGNDPLETYDDIEPSSGSFSAYTAITRGCDNYCSYCIVPHVRGRERSRPFNSIINEISEAARKGVREITLLGQNVNSYRFDDKNFADIIRAVNDVDGVQRIRFLTSHPKDLSDGILQAMSECKKAAPHLHLPLQSGNNRILKLMNRRYTREHYLELTEKTKSVIPGIALTTDIITGFPTETESEFEDTLDLIETVRFDDAFTYKYSPRPGAKAAGFPDDVPDKIKLERLEKLISKIRSIAEEKLRALIGSSCIILIEKESKKDRAQWMGRTEHNRTAVIPRADYMPGDFVPAVVKNLSGFTLQCHPISM